MDYSGYVCNEDGYDRYDCNLQEFCEYCGAAIGCDEGSCKNCGAPRKKIRSSPGYAGPRSDTQRKGKEKISVSVMILAFIFPPSVLLAGHTWKEDRPKNYRYAKWTAYASMMTLLFLIGASG